MECCICYEKKWVCKTNCQHEICLNCILLLNKVECPICRNIDVDFPDEAIKIIRNKNQQNIQSVPISFQNTTNSVAEPVVLYDSNDYYDEGHSFFRSRVTNVIQDIQVQNSIDYKNQSYIIAHCAIYYGNSFETELDDLDYQYFDENAISIDTSVYPFYRLPLIQNFYLNNLKLVDLERQKIDLKQFISTIYKNKSSNKLGKILSDNFSRFYEPIIDSKIDIGPK